MSLQSQAPNSYLATRMMIASIAVLTALTTCTPVFAQEEATRKLSRGQAKKLATDFLFGDSKKRERARGLLVKTRTEDRKNIVIALKKGVFAGKRQKVKGFRRIDIEGEDGKRPPGHYLVQFPTKYTGKKPFPLIIRLYGSGDTAKSYAEFVGSSKVSEKAIIVVPENPTPDRLGWNSKGVKAFVDEVIRDAFRRHNIDPDRLYLTGFSAGGGAANYLSQDWPHRVASFISQGRIYWKFTPEFEKCADCIAHMSPVFMVGLEDRADRVDGYRQTQAYYKKAGYQGMFRFAKSKGHEYLHKYDKEAFAHLLKQKRPAIPKEITAMFYFYPDDELNNAVIKRQQWLEATEHRTQHVVVKAEIKGNTVSLFGGAMKGFVYLNDDLVNLDEPVVLSLNGKDQEPMTVTRSVEFLLDQLEADRDQKRPYWTRIPFELE